MPILELCNVSDKVERLQIQCNSTFNGLGVCNLSILYYCNSASSHQNNVLDAFHWFYTVRIEKYYEINGRFMVNF